MLDYAPRLQPEYDASEVRLRMRLSRKRSLALLAVVIFTAAALLFIYTTAVDPDWHPKRIRGKGAWLVLLLFLLPVLWRAIALWTFGGVAALGLIMRTVRLADRRIDYVIGPDGITNVGLFYSRRVAWKYIDRIEVYKDRNLTSAWVKPVRGHRIDVVERFPGTSRLHLFRAGSILIPLELVDLSIDQFADIVHRFRPGLAVGD
ncbi:hypothetical protein EOD03_10055 [Mesorhizobium sp. M7A.T.Ca.TU.009.01.1.2]|nr:hypothetical protein EOD03_10055 [Mesorhizobium sp. M7A.T.Ca.TU.009.01.1.2]